MADAQPPLDSSHYHRRVTVAQGRDWPLAPGSLAAHILTHGTLLVEYYAPHGTDTQRPHTRDELYVVISGTGWFVNGPERHEFGPGDVLFVPAGELHRFEAFSDDFAVWVVFYGPEGGEAAG